MASSQSASNSACARRPARNALRASISAGGLGMLPIGSVGIVVIVDTSLGHCVPVARGASPSLPLSSLTSRLSCKDPVLAIQGRLIPPAQFFEQPGPRQLLRWCSCQRCRASTRLAQGPASQKACASRHLLGGVLVDQAEMVARPQLGDLFLQVTPHDAPSPDSCSASKLPLL